MTRITEKDKLNINIAYSRLHSYAAVARELGFSASTVKKYVVKDFQIPDETAFKRVTLEDVPDRVDLDLFIAVENLGDLLTLTEDELDELPNLWKELAL